MAKLTDINIKIKIEPCITFKEALLFRLAGGKYMGMFWQAITEKFKTEIDGDNIVRSVENGKE